MPLTLEQFLSLDFSYPGISFDFESWALNSYLSVLEEQIEHAQAQYRLRAERQLVREKAELADSEYGSRLSEICEAADAQIPRFFRIGAVVSIWGLFESSLTDFALYVSKRENIGLSFKDIRANNFRGQIETFFEKVARIQIPWSPDERERLAQLQELRNFLAHRNGRLMDLPQQAEKKIRDLVGNMQGVSIDGSLVLVTPEYIAFAADLVCSCVGSFNLQILNRYAPSTSVAGCLTSKMDIPVPR